MSTQEGSRVASPTILSVFGTNAVFAALSSVITKATLHPIDTVKCRVQAHQYPNGLRSDFFPRWTGHWGPADLYRGLAPKLAFYAPYQACYMGMYQSVREWQMAAFPHINGDPSINKGDTHGSRRPPLRVVIVAALSAELAGAVFRVPMETFKLRLQASRTSNTKEILRELFSTADGVSRAKAAGHGFRRIYRNGGPQTLLHDIPYSMIQWCLYETFQSLHNSDVLSNEGSDAGGGGSTLKTFLAGSGAGVITAFITTPLDVLKTRIIVQRGQHERHWHSHRKQGQGSNSATCTGQRQSPLGGTSMRSIVRQVFKEEPVTVMFRGVSMRMLWIGSNMGVYFSLFEGMKTLLHRHQQQPEGGAVTPQQG